MTHYVSQNFSMFSGDDKLLRVTITDANNGDLPFNLTGTTSTIWKAGRTSSSAVKVTKTLGSGITITDAVNGILEITLTPADTAALQGDYYHELQIVDASGKKRTVLAGTASIDDDLVED